VGGDVRIEPWDERDLPLLKRTLGDPEMTRFVGGPEDDEKLAERQGRFERLAETGAGQMFKIVDEATGEAVGSVGYWDSESRGEDVYEMGWFVLPEFQGRGVATAATTHVIERLRSDASTARSTRSRRWRTRLPTRFAASSGSPSSRSASSSTRRAT
jgi:RimJ/RimL family protein N-acetyltransferase